MRDWGVKIENQKLDITHKLLELVKKRKTSIVVTKQNSDYKATRRISRGYSGESYSYESEE